MFGRGLKGALNGAPGYQTAVCWVGFLLSRARTRLCGPGKESKGHYGVILSAILFPAICFLGMLHMAIRYYGWYYGHKPKVLNAKRHVGISYTTALMDMPSGKTQVKTSPQVYINIDTQPSHAATHIPSTLHCNILY